MRILGALAGAALLLGAPSAYAVSITNGDFESSSPTSASFAADGYSQEETTSSALGAWEVSSGNVDIVGTTGTFHWQQPNNAGNFSIDLAGNQSGTIRQNITGMTVGQQYTVSFMMAANPGSGNPAKLEVGMDDGQLKSLTFTPQNATNMGWVDATFVFVATATDQFLHFSDLGTTGCCGAALDNVSIAATPIPGAILLFGSALGGMGFLGARRKKLETAA
jgi:choice-of-anchor C domain-containing protein